MAALLGEAADPSRESDQRGPRGADVADAQLGHREIEDGIPRASGERDGSERSGTETAAKVSHRTAESDRALARAHAPTRALIGS
jgi:hypothetical protein